MSNYNLQQNEYLVLKSGEVYLVDDGYNELDELILTNKNLVYVTYVPTNQGGFNIFKKTEWEYVVQQYPIAQIKVFNGQAQALLGEGEEGSQLDIYFINGTSLSFQFICSGKRKERKRKEEDQITEWINAINSLLTNTQNGYESSTNMSQEKETMKCSSCGAAISGIKGQIAHCQYCGTSQLI
jgi:hypothetical protein